MKKFISMALVALVALSMLTACSKGGSDATPTPEPTPTPKIYFQNPLTGLEKDFNYPDGKRPIAVMVNNIMDGGRQMAWPHRGLSKADVIYEMETEGGITRMIALFSDYKNLPVVGPVRSARDQFVQMMFPSSCLYVHVGGSTYAKEMLSKYKYSDKDLDGDHKNITYRDQGRLATKEPEHTAFTNGELISKAVEKYALDDSQDNISLLFDWVKYDEPKRELNGTAASNIKWKFSTSYSAEVKYDSAKNTYTKDQTYLANGFTKTIVDENNNMQPVEYDNVFVLWTQIDRYPDTNKPNGQSILSRVDLAWGGVGYYFNGGKVEKVRWLKGKPEKPLRIVDMEGNEIDVKINPGKSYIAMVDLDMFGTYKIDDTIVDVSGEYKPDSEIKGEVAEGEAKD